MSQKVQVISFEGGALRRLAGGESSREAVLALPLDRFLMRLVRVPADVEPQAVAESALQAVNPFPDEALTVSVETVSEAASGKTVLAAAMPESAVEDVGEALDAEKLSVMRIDALVFGRLRRIWGQLGEMTGVRKLVAFKTATCLETIVLDDGLPSAVRAVNAASDLRREMMLVLLEAEAFAGARPLAETVVVVPPETSEDEKSSLKEAFSVFGGQTEDGLATLPSGFALLSSCGQTEDGLATLPSGFAPLSSRSQTVPGLASVTGFRILLQDQDAGLVGVEERTAEAGSLNALPASWREMLDETRFKRKLTGHLLAAGLVLALALGVLFGVPITYDQMAKHQKGLSREHARKYKEVREMKEKTDLVKKYSDHTRGALEIMKAVSDRLPAGVELTSWTYRREDGVSVAGESSGAEPIYEFKDNMEAVAYGEDEDSERVFPVVDLTGPSASRNGQRFSLNCGYAKEEEME